MLNDQSMPEPIVDLQTEKRQLAPPFPCSGLPLRFDSPCQSGRVDSGVVLLILSSFDD